MTDFRGANMQAQEYEDAQQTLLASAISRCSQDDFSACRTVFDSAESSLSAMTEALKRARTALVADRETMRLVSKDRRVIGPISTRALSDCHRINEALAEIDALLKDAEK